MQKERKFSDDSALLRRVLSLTLDSEGRSLRESLVEIQRTIYDYLNHPDTIDETRRNGSADDDNGE